MTPAEVWQGGKLVNIIEGDNMHQGKLNGNRVLVKDDYPGCVLVSPLDKKHIDVGDSIALDGGEIVKSVNGKPPEE